VPEDKGGKRGTGKAPIIIFGTMVAMSLVTVAIVFVKHAQRDQPYLQSKLRRVRHMQQPRANTLSLNYAAFGPQAIAYEIIGNRWWQWQETAGETPPEDFDIKVIVYRGASSQELLEKFPVIEEKRIDSRYLKYEDAVAYLDRHIAKNESAALTATLEQTRARLTRHFEP
jgi:hypothetical protein